MNGTYILIVLIIIASFAFRYWPHLELDMQRVKYPW